MKITKITQQVKRKDRYSIYVDDKYAFSLSEGMLIASGVHSGQELASEELKEYKQKSSDDKLFNLALRYVAMRPRSRYEVETYLTRKQAPPPLSEEILNKLSDLRFIDDVVFARQWIENRRLLKPLSRRKIIMELKQKRVAEEIIRSALDEDEADETEVLRELIAKKQRQAKYREDPTKLMQYLARQGFSYDDIKSAMRSPDD